GAAAASFTSAVVGSAAAAGFSVGSFLTGTIGGKLILSLGLSALSQALTRRRQTPPSERFVNLAQPVSYAEWVIGRTRKGGPLGFTGFATGNDAVTGQSGAKRHYSPVVA